MSEIRKLRFRSYRPLISLIPATQFGFSLLPAALDRIGWPPCSEILSGYVFANFENGKTKRDEWIDGFQAFVDERFKNRLSINWCDLILSQEKDEVMAFRRFFELLDEYMELKNKKNQRRKKRAPKT